MKVPRRLAAVAIGCILTAGLLTGSGCTKYASQDDLQRLNEAEKAAILAEKELDQVKASRRQGEQELTAKQEELRAAKAELEKVKMRVADGGKGDK